VNNWLYWSLFVLAILIVAGGVWLADWESERKARRDAELWRHYMGGRR
jgi:hypothetical protein